MISLKLKLVRESAECALTNLLASLQDSELDRLSVTCFLNELNNFKHRLTELNEQYEIQLTEKLTNSDGSEETEIYVLSELKKIEDYTTKIDSALLKAETVLKIEDDNSIISTENANNQNNPHSIKLPKINLPTYAGNILEWREFYESFKTSVIYQTLKNLRIFADS